MKRMSVCVYGRGGGRGDPVAKRVKLGLAAPGRQRAVLLVLHPHPQVTSPTTSKRGSTSETNFSSQFRDKLEIPGPAPHPLPAFICHQPLPSEEATTRPESGLDCLTCAIFACSAVSGPFCSSCTRTHPSHHPGGWCVFAEHSAPAPHLARPEGVSGPFCSSCTRTHPSPTTSERRGKNLKGVKDL